LTNCKEFIEEYEEALHPKLPVTKRSRPIKEKGKPPAHLALCIPNPKVIFYEGASVLPFTKPASVTDTPHYCPNIPPSLVYIYILSFLIYYAGPQ